MPPDAVQVKMPHPVAANMALAALLAGLNLYQFVLLPLFLLPQSPWWLVTLIVPAVLNPTLWYTIHESFHGGLHTDRRFNDACGRGLCVLHGAPWHVARFGHLMHHRFNRSELDRPDVYDPEVIPGWRARAIYYFRLLGGLYLVEFATYLVYLLSGERIRAAIRKLLERDEPQAMDIAKAAQHSLGSSATIDAVRMDLALTFLLLFVSQVAYATAGYWYVPAGIILVRAVMISLLDNLPHYATPLNTPKYAYNLALPTAASRLILNFNHHRTHHHAPTSPWSALPALLRESGETLETPYFAALLRQFKGPIPTTDPKLHNRES